MVTPVVHPGLNGSPGSAFRQVRQSERQRVQVIFQVKGLDEVGSASVSSRSGVRCVFATEEGANLYVGRVAELGGFRTYIEPCERLLTVPIPEDQLSFIAVVVEHALERQRGNEWEIALACEGKMQKFIDKYEVSITHGTLSTLAIAQQLSKAIRDPEAASRSYHFQP